MISRSLVQRLVDCLVFILRQRGGGGREGGREEDNPDCRYEVALLPPQCESLEAVNGQM